MQLSQHTATVNDPNYIKYIIRRRRRSVFGEKVIQCGYILIVIAWVINAALRAFSSVEPLSGASDYLWLVMKFALYVIVTAPLMTLAIMLGTVIIDFVLAGIIYLITPLRPLLFKKSVALEELWEMKRNEVVTDINNLCVGIRDRLAQESQHNNYQFLRDYQKLEPGIGQQFIDYYEREERTDHRE